MDEEGFLRSSGGNGVDMNAVSACLELQLRTIRKSMPPYLVSISQTVFDPPAFNDDDRNICVACTEGGYVTQTHGVIDLSKLPKEETISDGGDGKNEKAGSSTSNKSNITLVKCVDATIVGPADSPYAGETYDVRMYFDDFVPYLVGFRSVISHMGTQNGLILDPHFYEMVGNEKKGGDEVPPDVLAEENKRSLHRTLTTLQKFLRAPLHPCENCELNFRHMGHMEEYRRQIREQYLPQALHPEFLSSAQDSWKREWLHSDYLKAFPLQTNGSGEEVEGIDLVYLKSIIREEAEGIFSFPFLSKEFCKTLIDEVDHYNECGLPVKRPNSMNNYGIILNEIGMANVITSLQRRYLQPLARLLFPVEGSSFDNHHSFIVQYEKGADLGLDMHTDDSDVTFNVCLGREFSGALLSFCGGLGKPDHRKLSLEYAHVIGRCVVHVGHRRHGAENIESGQRMNLIIWCHNHAFRNSIAQPTYSYQKEGYRPDPVCLSYTHDRDYYDYHKENEESNERSDKKWKGRGRKQEKKQNQHHQPWCPPAGMEFQD